MNIRILIYSIVVIVAVVTICPVLEWRLDVILFGLSLMINELQ